MEGLEKEGLKKDLNMTYTLSPCAVISHTLPRIVPSGCAIRVVPGWIIIR